MRLPVGMGQRCVEMGIVPNSRSSRSAPKITDKYLSNHIQQIYF